MPVPAPLQEAAAGTVHALWRYPVKSMQGEQVDAVLSLALGRAVRLTTVAQTGASREADRTPPDDVAATIVREGRSPSRRRPTASSTSRRCTC